MDFDEAMELVQAGRVIARQGWPGTDVVRPRSDRLINGVYMNWVSTVSVTTADALADDWVDLGPLQ